MNGHRAAPVNSAPSGRSPGMNTLKANVCPSTFHDQLGNIRRAPSSMPMKKSGCEPDEIDIELKGPYSQIGLICAKVAIRASTPKRKKKNAAVLAMKYGYIGWPTTFWLVWPLPGIWVCF